MTSSTASSTRARMMLITVPVPRPAGLGSWPGAGGEGQRSQDGPPLAIKPVPSEGSCGLASPRESPGRLSSVSGILATHSPVDLLSPNS